MGRTLGIVFAILFLLLIVGNLRSYAINVPETDEPSTMKNDYQIPQQVDATAYPTGILDQQQTDYSQGGGGAFIAQSFKPTLTLLTRVDFYMVETIGDAKLDVYSAKTTENGTRPASFLGSVTVPDPAGLPRWVEFVFSRPISLRPENTYFLVMIFDDIVGYGVSNGDLYTRGEGCRFHGDLWRLWEVFPWDYAFKTYGYTPTLTISTNGVSSHSPVNVSVNGQNKVAVCDTSPLEMSADVRWIDGYGTIRIEIDQTRLLTIDANMRYFFTNWTRQGTDNPLTTSLLENKSFVANFKTQYLTNMIFKDNGGTNDLNPTYMQALTPNGNFATFTSFINEWLDIGTYTLKQVIWQNNDVTPQATSTYTSTAGGTWNVNCRVYLVNFADCFKDSSGASLYAAPSSFRLTFPNSTTSPPLSRESNPLGSYLIQNGTTFWSSIIWEGSEVVTPNTYFDAKDGNPAVNCQVYSLKCKA